MLISSHRKLLSSKAMLVNVAEKSGQDPDRQGQRRASLQHGRPFQKIRQVHLAALIKMVLAPEKGRKPWQSLG